MNGLTFPFVDIRMKTTGAVNERNFYDKIKTIQGL